MMRIRRTLDKYSPVLKRSVLLSIRFCFKGFIFGYEICVMHSSLLNKMFFAFFLQLLQLEIFIQTTSQGLSQDLETGCLKLAIVKYLGVQIFKGDHNILRLQP